MTSFTQNRRQVLAGLAALATSLAATARAGAHPLVQVAKDANCGCCGNWVAILDSDGFETEVRNLSYDALQGLKTASGISPDMASCHTAFVDGYVIEGHVPPADIRRLLDERPDALGLSVPGMPMGSPGMGPEDEREAYTVFLLRRDGTVEAFAQYEARA